MDARKKWSDFDIGCASNLSKALKKVKLDDFYGYEAVTLVKAMQWLDDLILVMKNPPVKFDDLIPKEKEQPAKITDNKTGEAITNASTTTGHENQGSKADAKAGRNTEKGTRSKSRGQKITQRQMGISV